MANCSLYAFFVKAIAETVSISVSDSSVVFNFVLPLFPPHTAPLLSIPKAAEFCFAEGKLVPAVQELPLYSSTVETPG